MLKPQLRVHLFGVMSLAMGEQAIPLPNTSASRRLLAYLLLQKDRAHARSTLAGTFWSELSEARARKSLSQALWQIRQNLPDLIEASAEEIAIANANTIWTDAHEFERKLRTYLSDAPENLNAIHLRATLALYRGDLLEGMYDDWLLLERERYNNLYLQGLEKLEKLEKMGRNYTRALDLTKKLLKLRPYDESFHREAMRLYHLLGKSNTAIRQYESCRQILRTEFDVEPESRTSLLAQEIKRQAPDIKSTYLPKPLKPPEPVILNKERVKAIPLVGREEPRSKLLQYIETVFQQAGGLVLVEGDAGVGKTRLLREIAQDAEWRNAQTLWGYCLEQENARPFGAFVSAVTPNLPPLRVHQLNAIIDPLWLQVLQPLLPQIAQTLPHLGAPPPLKPEQERARVLEAMANFLIAWAKITPLLLIVEDLHWADEDTLRLLLILQNRLQEHRILIVGTFRREDARASSPVWEGLQALDRAGLRGRIRLGHLDQQTTGKLIQRALGLSHPIPLFERRIYQETNGNPLFVLETLRALQDENLLTQDEKGIWQTPWDDETIDYAELPLPQMVEQVIARRLKRLSLNSRKILDAGVVLGQQFDFVLLTAMCGLDTTEIIAAIQDLVNRHLWEETEDGYQFSHDKMWQVGLRALDAQQLRELHRRAMTAFESQSPEMVDKLAYHAEQAGEWEKAALYAYQAGQAAVTSHLYLSASVHFEKTLGFIAQVDHDVLDRFALLVAYEKTLDVLGNRDAQRKTLEIMQSLAKGDTKKSYRVYLRQAWHLANISRFDEAQEAAQEALTLAKELGDLSLQADALDVLGTALTWQGQSERSIEPLKTAIDIAQQLGDLKAETHYRSSLGSAYLGIRQYDQALKTMALSLQQSEQQDNLLEEADLCNLFGIAYMERGISEKALEFYQRSLECSQEIGYLHGEGRASVNLGNLYYFQGDLGKLLSFYDKAAAIFAQLDQKRGEAQIRLNRASVTQDILGYSQQVTEDAEYALAYGQQVGDKLSEGQALTILSEASRLQGDLKKARELLMQGIKKMEECGDRWLLVQEYKVLGYLDLYENLPEQAIEHLDYGLQICAELGMADMEVLLIAIKGFAHLHLGEGNKALALTTKAMEELKPGVEQPYLVPYWHAKVLDALGKEAESVEAIKEAYRLLKDVLKGFSPELRQQSLENVAEHREIVQMWQGNQPQRLRVNMPGIKGDTVDVYWTVELPDDEKIQKKVARRRHQLRRLLREAEEQGGLPTHQHLADALKVGLRTIERDIAALSRK